MLLAGCVSGGSSTSQPTKQVEEKPLPNYEIFNVEKDHIGSTTRVFASVAASLDLTQDDVLRISKAIVKEITSKENVDVIFIHFYESEKDYNAGYPSFAGLEWDYSTNEYKITRWDVETYKKLKEIEKK